MFVKATIQRLYLHTSKTYNDAGIITGIFLNNAVLLKKLIAWSGSNAPNGTWQYVLLKTEPAGRDEYVEHV